MSKIEQKNIIVDNDSETENDTKDKKRKTRGRPKKISIKNQKPPIELPTNEEEQLILRIPLYNNDVDNSSEKHIFKMKNIKDTDTKNDDSDNYIQTLNINSTTDSNTDNSGAQDVETLLFELKKKDQIIKKLKSQLSSQKSNLITDTTQMMCEESTKKIIDLKLFDINNNNIQIVVDKTDIACHWCSYNFDTMPCFIPDRQINDKYFVFGCFCSYSCAMKYNSNMGDYRVATRLSLIKKLCDTIFGNLNNLIEAPEKEILEKFGGYMPIKDFRSSALLCTKNFKMKIPPLVALVSVVEETYKEPSMNLKKMH
jgi:hypothetical protein